MYQKNNKISILHLGKFSLSEPGGIETVQRLNKKYLNKKVNWFSVNFTRKPKAASNKNEICFPALKLGSQPVSFRYFLHGIFLSKNFDLVHIHLPNYLALLCSFFIKKQKLIFHWHSDIINKGALGYFLRSIERHAVKRASRIVFTSDCYRKNSYLNSGNQEVIPLGVELKAKITSEVSDTNGKVKTLQFLTIGRLVDYKNHLELINQFVELPDHWHLKIVGDGPNYHKLQTAINKNILSHRIKLCGKLDSSELNQVISSSQAFVLWSNSRAEAYGLVLLEAYMQGLPLIIYNNEGSGMVDIAHRAKFCVLTKTMIKDQIEIHRLVSNSDRPMIKKDAQSKFSIQNEIENWLFLYTEVLSYNR